MLKIGLLNLLLYIVISLPIILIGKFNNIKKSKKIFIHFLLFSVCLESFFAYFIYNYSKYFFSLFTETQGIINLSVHCSKIIFICTPLLGFKFLVPYTFNSNKKIAILAISKIATNIIFGFIGQIAFNFKGLLYSFPLCDLIFYIIYIIYFIKYLKSN